MRRNRSEEIPDPLVERGCKTSYDPGDISVKALPAVSGSQKQIEFFSGSYQEHSLKKGALKGAPCLHICLPVKLI
jgi:hypothetical protein